MSFRDPINYIKHAQLQRKIAMQLVEYAKDDLKRASNVLDLGCGTGFIGEEALKINPHLNITGVESSPEMCKYAEKIYHKIINRNLEELFELKGFDLTISSMCLQWIKNQDALIQRVNSPFYFATPLSGNLKEIDNCFKMAKIPSPILEFKSPSLLKPFHIETYTETFQNLISALKSFNKIGARNSAYSHTLTISEVRKLESLFDGNVAWQIGFFKV